MAQRKTSAPRARHDTRKWILRAFESAKEKEGLMTSEIKRKITQLSGKRIPDFSVYSALRTLIRRKVLVARRRGRQFQFRLTGSPPASSPKPVARPARAAPAPSAPPARSVAPVVATRPPPAPVAPQVHKLAPGESVILHVGDAHVETATNVHGKIVLERHRRPTK